MTTLEAPKVGGANGPLTAAVSRSSSGDGSAVVAGTAGKQIRVVGFVLTAASGVVAYWKPSAGNWSDATFPAMDLAATPSSQYAVGDEFLEGVLPDLPSGAGLMLNLDAAVSVTGFVVYRLI